MNNREDSLDPAASLASILSALEPPHGLEVWREARRAVRSAEYKLTQVREAQRSRVKPSGPEVSAEASPDSESEAAALAAKVMAARDHAILSSMVDAHCSRTTTSVWLSALGLDLKADPSDVHFRISVVLGLPRQVRAGVEALPLSAGLRKYLADPIPAISQWIFSASSGVWRDEPFGTWMALNDFQSHWVQHLLMVSEELTRSGLYVHMSGQSVDEIRQLVEQLRDLMREPSELPSEIADFIRVHIDEIMDALNLSMLQGSAELRRVIRSAYGDLLLRASEFEGKVPKGDPRWRKFWEIVHKAAELAQVAQLIALPVATVQLVELAERARPPAIVVQAEPSPSPVIQIPPKLNPASVPPVDVRGERSDVFETGEP